jgi:hypothetical protein
MKPLVLNDSLTSAQRQAVHYFDERGHSVLSQQHLVAENNRLTEENERLKAIILRMKRRQMLTEGQARA